MNRDTFLKVAVTLPVAAAGAGLAVAISPESQSIASTPSVNQHLVDNCETDAAMLYTYPNVQGIGFNILSANKVKVDLRALPEKDLFDNSSDGVDKPECNNFDITRSTTVDIYENGKSIGISKDLLNPVNDNGERISRIVKTGKIGCDKNILVSFVTTAKSPDDSDSVTHTSVVSSKTNC